MCVCGGGGIHTEGLAMAAATFGSIMPEKVTESFVIYAKAVWASLIRNGDLVEDAPNYNRIDVTVMWMLWDVLGAPPIPHNVSTTLHGMFVRFKNQISPSGIIPSYGDSGGTLEARTNPNASSWPYDNQWGGFVAGFERAATVWNDGNLKRAARTMFEAGIYRQPLGTSYPDVAALFHLSMVATRTGTGANGTLWTNHTLLPASPAATFPGGGGHVQMRADEYGTRVLPGTLVLRGRYGDANRAGGTHHAAAAAEADPGGMGANAAFTLSDMYSGVIPTPPHAHENQHGQINHYEYLQSPLASSLGYDNRGPVTSPPPRAPSTSYFVFFFFLLSFFGLGEGKWGLT